VSQDAIILLMVSAAYARAMELTQARRFDTAAEMLDEGVKAVSELTDTETGLRAAALGEALALAFTLLHHYEMGRTAGDSDAHFGLCNEGFFYFGTGEIHIPKDARLSLVARCIDPLMYARGYCAGYAARVEMQLTAMGAQKRAGKVSR